MRMPLCSFFFFQAEDGIRDYKVTEVQTCALPICRLIVQEHNPARLREWQVRTDRFAVERYLLQNLPVGGVAGIEPGAFAQQSAAPAEREQALAGLARIGQPLLQIVDLPGEQIEPRPSSVLLVRRQQPRSIVVGRFEDAAAIERFLPANHPADLRLGEERLLLPIALESEAGRRHFGEDRRAIVRTRTIHGTARDLLPTECV